MRSDDAANSIVTMGWDRIRGSTSEEEFPDSYFGLVMIGDIEFKRFEITRDDYEHDECAPAKAVMKRLRNEIAKGIRREYSDETNL